MQLKCNSIKECWLGLGNKPTYEKCYNCTALEILDNPITMHTFDGTDFTHSGGEKVTLNNTIISDREKIIKFSKDELPQHNFGQLADRKNEGKLRWRNFPMFLLKPLMEVAQYGEGKYDMYNFLKGGSQNQYLDCIKRHLEKYENPFEDDLDDESKVSHLAHTAWNALVAIYMLEHHPELDDRYKISK